MSHVTDTLKRRDFLAASAAAALASAAGAQTGADGAPAQREFYELREIELRRGPMQQRADEYLRNALIPALRRLGCGPIGVFNVMVGPQSPTVYVLIPHPSLDGLINLRSQLAGDAEYQKAGAAFTNSSPTDPSYVDRRNTLLHAFEQMPKVDPPGGGQRIFELRTYRSHSEKAAAKKIDMFNRQEIAIFRRVGLRPVFFAQRLIGNHLPSLTYMLTYPDLAAREKNWNTFRNDPEWKKLSTTPGYTDAEIVASITNVFLTPAPYSQI